MATIRIINHKTRKIVIDNDGGTACYSNLLRMALNRTPERGFTPAEMRERQAIMAKFVANEDDAVDLPEFELTPTQFAKVYQLCQEPWPISAPELVKFLDYMDALNSAEKT